MHDSLWGRHGWSSITQPPVYGWTVAELDRRGIAVPDSVIERARAGLRFLLDVRRRSPSGLVEIVHPWESGCDHSPRWDDLVDPVPPGSGDPTEGDDTDQLDSALYDADRYDDARWFERKGVLLTTIERTPAGSPIHNPEFAIGSVAFSAVSAWAAIELGNAIGDGDLVAGGRDLATSLMARWDPVLRTYVDDGPASGRVRTAEGLLPVLIEQRPDVVATIGSAARRPRRPRRLVRPGRRSPRRAHVPGPQLLAGPVVATDRPVAGDRPRCRGSIRRRPVRPSRSGPWGVAVGMGRVLGSRRRRAGRRRSPVVVDRRHPRPGAALTSWALNLRSPESPPILTLCRWSDRGWRKHTERS